MVLEQSERDAAVAVLEGPADVDVVVVVDEYLPPVPAEPDPEPLSITTHSTPSSVPMIIDMEADISQLEAPTFTTISRGPPEPMLRLNWNHKVNLIGEKVLNPMIYCCDQCDKPILIYGRMIPCKHVFCLRCARSDTLKVCPRCKEKVIRVEQTGLGTVFMCTHGGTRYGSSGCRRTYLSQRDLQAHINHRHVTNPPLPPQPPAPILQQPHTVQIPVQPMELSPMSKLMADKIAGGATAPMRKNSSEQLNSPRSGMLRGGIGTQTELGDNFFNYTSYSTGHSAGSQHLHMLNTSGSIPQQSPVQQHLSRSSGYSPYGHQTSSPQNQQQQSSSTSISSSLWSHSTNQYYR